MLILASATHALLRDAQVERNVLKGKTAPVTTFVLIETYAPTFSDWIDRNEIIAHRLALNTDARSTPDDRHLAIVPSFWLNRCQVRDVLVPMEYQTDLSADAPLHEILRFIKGNETLVTAKSGKDALIQRNRLRGVVHRMVMDERDIEVIVYLPSAMNFVVVFLGSRETLAQAHAATSKISSLA